MRSQTTWTLFRKIRKAHVLFLMPFGGAMRPDSRGIGKPYGYKSILSQRVLIASRYQKHFFQLLTICSQSWGYAVQVLNVGLRAFKCRIAAVYGAIIDLHFTVSHHIRNL